MLFGDMGVRVMKDAISDILQSNDSGSEIRVMRAGQIGAERAVGYGSRLRGLNVIQGDESPTRR